ncbi:carotenoid biosynthesis protein [Ascidiimonas sp. W6]|uniref:carotenoid biosynthesis protein n=1 Tax=Ascidiimonas meishanensis TaxID=3128903 RepID=UPI0030EBCBB7
MEAGGIVNKIKKDKDRIAIGIVWLLHLSAIIGIAFGFEEWFISLTPINLLVLFALIIWVSNHKKNILLLLLIPFIIGYIAEVLGVNFGLIFGDYVYGENLGIKVLDVPIIIGINWAILTYITSNISRQIHPNTFLSAAIAALLMTSLDVLIEVSAPRFDYWRFDNGFAPVQNYIGWYFISLISCFTFQKFYKKGHFMLSFHIFTAITIYFTVFLYI